MYFFTPPQKRTLKPVVAQQQQQPLPPLPKFQPYEIETYSLEDEKYLYNISYFSKEEIKLLYDLFHRINLNLEGLTENIIYQTLSFLVHIPNGIEELSSLFYNEDLVYKKEFNSSHRSNQSFNTSNNTSPINNNLNSNLHNSYNNNNGNNNQRPTTTTTTTTNSNNNNKQPQQQQHHNEEDNDIYNLSNDHYSLNHYTASLDINSSDLSDEDEEEEEDEEEGIENEENKDNEISTSESSSLHANGAIERAPAIIAASLTTTSTTTATTTTATTAIPFSSDDNQHQHNHNHQHQHQHQLDNNSTTATATSQASEEAESSSITTTTKTTNILSKSKDSNTQIIIEQTQTESAAYLKEQLQLQILQSQNNNNLNNIVYNYNNPHDINDQPAISTTPTNVNNTNNNNTNNNPLLTSNASLISNASNTSKITFDYDYDEEDSDEKPPSQEKIESINLYRSQFSIIRDSNLWGGKTLKEDEFDYIDSSSEVLKYRMIISYLTENLFSYIRKRYNLPPNRDPSIIHLIEIISIMTRGTLKEKSELVFKLCRKKSEGAVYKTELLEMIQGIDALTVLNVFGLGSIGTPDEVVNNIYREGLSTVNSIQRTPSFPRSDSFYQKSMSSEQPFFKDTSLEMKEFIKRSVSNSDIPRCFGFFDLIYLCYVKPIEDYLKSSIKYKQASGYLYYEKYLGIIKAYSLRWFEVRSGFLIGYKRLFSKPSKVICLFKTNVKIIPKEHPKHHMKLKSLFKGSLSKQIDGNKEATDFILRRYDDTEQTFISLSSHRASNFVNAIRENSKGSYRYHSFASPQEDINVVAYINGSHYFKGVYKALKHAVSEIYIAGWWISPNVSLNRTSTSKTPDKYRLDTILMKKASEGVKIYILIWDETMIAMDLGSRGVKSFFEKMHRRNIKVIRHPHMLPLYWSHHQKVVVVDQRIAFIGGLDLCFGRYDNEYYFVKDNLEINFPGADYINSCIAKPVNNLKDCLVDRNTQPRMPWHDVSISLDGKAARDVTYNFIQRWNHAKDSNRDYKSYPYLLSSLETVAPISSSGGSGGTGHNVLSTSGNSVINSHTGTNTNTVDELPHPQQQPLPTIHAQHHSQQQQHHPQTRGTCKVQIVRSVCGWSAGQVLENSIYKAYLNLINLSQHFIYIQNQFFISSVGFTQPNNQVAFAIYKRIEKAVLLNQVFRVIILLPVHCEGDIYDVDTQLIIKYTEKSINGIKNELLKKFPELNIDQYLTINSLRNWDANGDIIFTEQIYVHSKILIVDDKIAIIGSANINDRSLNGSRDSEICAIIEDRELVDSRVNGLPFKAAKFAHQLRCSLWEYHLGLVSNPDPLLSDRIKDLVIDSTYFDIWKSMASKNSAIYKEVFGTTIPENCTKTSQYNRGSIKLTSVALETLCGINGFLIDYNTTMLSELETPTSIYSDIITSMKLFL